MPLSPQVCLIHHGAVRYGIVVPGMNFDGDEETLQKLLLLLLLSLQYTTRRRKELNMCGEDCMNLCSKVPPIF